MSCNNLKYSDDVSRTKRIIKGMKRQNQNEYLSISWKFVHYKLLISKNLVQSIIKKRKMFIMFAYWSVIVAAVIPWL